MFAGLGYGVPCLSQRRLSERLFRPLALVTIDVHVSQRSDLSEGLSGGLVRMSKTHNLFTLMCIVRNGATPATHGKRGKADHKYCRLIVICNVSISTSREVGKSLDEIAFSCLGRACVSCQRYRSE